MEIKLEQLGSSFKKTDPACASCGYDADWIWRLGRHDRLFCEHCLVNATLDAWNFQGVKFDGEP